MAWNVYACNCTTARMRDTSPSIVCCPGALSVSPALVSLGVSPRPVRSSAGDCIGGVRNWSRDGRPAMGDLLVEASTELTVTRYTRGLIGPSVTPAGLV